MWHKPKSHLHKLIFLSAIISLLLNQLSPLLIFAASSPWSQTDWSTESGTNVDTTSTTGQITLSSNGEELSNTDFESNLTSWDTPDYSTTLQNTQADNIIAYYPLNETSGSVAEVTNVATTTGRELALDNDMEAADTSYWTAINNATLSKETADPHGGSNNLKIA